jgi:hypothetical protein
MPYDDYDAKREGWALFECDDGTLQLQRVDVPSDVDPALPSDPLFVSDEAAMEYVKARAAQGSELHIAALALHGQDVDDYDEPCRGPDERNMDDGHDWK